MSVMAEPSHQLATSILLRSLMPRWARWKSGVVGLVLAGEYEHG